MDLLESLGISPIASATRAFYPVSLTAATGRDVYAEVAALGITIPPPQPIPKEATQWLGLQYLEACWMQAAKWVAVTEDKRRAGPRAWRSFLSKEKNQAAMLAAVAALHELREKGSDLSPALWCWWRMTQLLEKGDTPFFFFSIWGEAALKSPKMRRWYYEEVAADILCKKKLWPTQATAAFALIRDFLDQATSLNAPEKQKALWDNKYSARFEACVQNAALVKVAAEAALSAKAQANDLGVWLSADLIGYMKLANVGLSMTSASTPLTTTVRRRKLKAGG